MIVFLNRRLAIFEENLNKRLIQKSSKRKTISLQMESKYQDLRLTSQNIGCFQPFHKRPGMSYKKLDGKGIDMFKG